MINTLSSDKKITSLFRILKNDEVIFLVFLNKSFRLFVLSILWLFYANVSIAFQGPSGLNCPDELEGFTALGIFGNSKYYISNHSNSWQNASIEAAALNGYLASIDSEEENNFIKNNLGTTIAFIGMSDDQTEGDFYWDSGEAVGYTNWANNSNNNADNDYGVINFWAGTWSLENRRVYKRFILEVPCSGSNEPCQLSISDVIFPTVILPNEVETLMATITNDGNQPSLATQVNVYQLRNSIQGPPPINFIQNGASIPALPPGASFTIQFDIIIPMPHYVGTIFPEEFGFTFGNYALVIAEDAASVAYLNCNAVFEFEVDFIDTDLAIDFVNNEACYGEDYLVQADLRVTNLGPMTTIAPIFVNLGTEAFVNPNPPHVIFNPSYLAAFWKISEPLAPGESAILTRPYSVPSGSTSDYDFSPFIEMELSNVEDLNNANNNTTTTIIFSEDCGGASSCDYQNAQWLNDLLAMEEALCSACVGLVNVYELDNTIYIGTLADNNNCADGFTTIYTCDGSVFCMDGGIAGLNECEDWWNSNPTLVETLWRRIENCPGDLPARIQARAWWDENSNGIRDLGVDGGIENLLIQVENQNGIVVDAARTEPGGVVDFRELSPGTYRLAFEVPEDADITTKNAPGSTASTNSEINPDGKTDFFTLAPGQFLTEVGGGFKDIDGGDRIDLELSLAVSNANPSLYDRVPMTYTIFNNSSTTATNISIRIGVCNTQGSSFQGNIGLFNQTNGLVNSSPSPSTSLGTYSLATQAWTIPQLAAGTSATLDLTVFVLTTEERILVGQLEAATPLDSDSFLGNMNNCMVMEDDEARFVLNGNTEELPDFELSIVGYRVSTHIFPDLIILEAGSTIPAGISGDTPFHGVTGSVPIPNQAYSTTSRIYLSTDDQIDNGDLVLNEALNIIIGIGTTVFQEGPFLPFTIPIDVSPGTYYLISKIDADDEVLESNEMNNEYKLPIEIIHGDCPCPLLDQPVCGSDGTTYANPCEAECNGIFSWIAGECGGVCTCENILNPVCGSNGVTYQNPCLAECDGVFDYTFGECPITGDGVDLELELLAPSTYNIYTKVLFQARLSNFGSINAENVKVDFPLPDGFVHSENAATHGAYDLFRETWNVGTVKAGETAVLDLTLFALTNASIMAYAQVSNAEPDDIDSTPGNGSCCTPNEDDEAAITISPNLLGDEVDLRSQNGSFSESNSTSYPSNLEVNLLTLYPNIATDEIKIFVQSKLPQLQLRIYNLRAEPVLKRSFEQTEGLQQLDVDVSSLPAGTYFVRLNGTLGRQTAKFVKVRM